MSSVKRRLCVGFVSLISAAGLNLFASSGSFADQAAGAEKSAGDWLVRGRLVAVRPAVNSTLTVIGGQAAIEPAYVPEIDVTWFWSDHIAAELIAGAIKHDVSVEGSLLGDVDLGSVWLVPPTLLAQYHFAPKHKFSPYVGAGINYTMFTNQDFPAAVASIEYENNFGLAFQAGIDIATGSTWFANIDIKKIFLQTDVVVNGLVEADVDIDPWVFGIGVGRIF